MYSLKPIYVDFAHRKPIEEEVDQELLLCCVQLSLELTFVHIFLQAKSLMILVSPFPELTFRASC